MGLNLLFLLPYTAQFRLSSPPSSRAPQPPTLGEPSLPSESQEPQSPPKLGDLGGENPEAQPIASSSHPTTTPTTHSSMESHTSPSTPAFDRIEQPLGLKLGVTAAGLGLMGLELWWFLFSKPKSQHDRKTES